MKKKQGSSKSLESFFDKISQLSKVQKILICVVPIVVMVGLAVYFLYMPKNKQITQLTDDYDKLMVELADAKRRASELGKYKAEMKKVEAQFELASQALPEGEEIPELLTNISHAGQDAELEFLLFKPEQEKPVGFYSEIPVSIQVIGTYHEAARFFHKVSQLSRIVNIKDIRMNAGGNRRRQAEQGEQDILNISCTAVTYMFVESAAAPKTAKK